MTCHAATLLRLMFLLLGGTVLMSPVLADEEPDTGSWVTSPEGQTCLRSFQNAPFPHSSRAKGYTYNGTFFDTASHYSDSTVGIFIPAGYHPADSVDFVVHFHGWTNHVAAVLDHYELRQQLVQSGRNAILLTPQGPKDASDSSGGRLEKEPGAFQALLEEVTHYLLKAGKIRTNRIGHIVLSAHSGGYNVTSALLAQGGMRDRITDVLLFDASYGGLEGFSDWAGAGHGRRLVSLFTRHLAPENFMLISLLQKRHTPFETLLEPDLTERALLPRRTLFLHTLDLEHDEVMHKRGYFALFLRTSALTARVR